MARGIVSSTSRTSTEKRKFTDSHSDGKVKEYVEFSDKRRKTLDAYFHPQTACSSTSTSNSSTIGSVILNPEQTRVLEMVVDEGKNVFFTGAAGTLTFSGMLRIPDA